MVKVHVLTHCEHCNGEAYLPVGVVESYAGEMYTHYLPCPECQGSGNQPRWVSLEEFATLLNQAQCPHEHASYHGGMHFSAGDVWDDIQEVCDDCGANLDKP